MVTGALLINLGTPESPTASAVKEYLAEFLMDPLVIDIAKPFRWALVHGAILRTRPEKTAAQYQQVWTERGSPLLFHSLDLAEKVQTQLGKDFKVAVGMRYGNPSLRQAAEKLIEAGVEKIVAFPLYPQYSLAATESSSRELCDVLKKIGWNGPVSFISDFYEDPRFIDAAAEAAERKLAESKPDFIVFSFHGLPERQVRKTDSSGKHCLAAKSCCDGMTEVNRNCYRAQCFATARALSQRLNLDQAKTAVAFQSRLGRTPWIQPFTDHLYESLPKRGVRRLAVLCPSFVADCLETLEEVQIRGKKQFLAAGGEELALIPCVNSSDPWADGVASFIQEYSQK